MENITINKYSLITLSGRNLELEQTLEVKESGMYIVRYKVFGARCIVTNKDKSIGSEEVIKIDSFDCSSSVVKEIKKVWGIETKAKTNLFFKISKSDFEMIMASEKEFYRPREEQKAIEQAEQEAMPKFTVYQNYTEWGDYSITTHSQIIRLRNLTDRELSKSNSKEQRLVYVDSIMSDVVQPKDLGIELLEPFGEYRGEKAYLLNEEQVSKIKEATVTKREKRQRIEKAQKLAKERANERKKEAETARKLDVEQNELMMFSAGTIYSKAGSEMLHSLAAIFSEKTIGIYTTTYAKSIPNAQTTLRLIEELKKSGFVFNDQSKYWEVENTEKGATLVIDFLKKYDTKVWPGSIGFERCWECGTYSHRSKLKDGYCGC